MTTLPTSVSLLRIGPYDHAIGREGRACPHAFAVTERDPAILAGSHEAETSARFVTEFEMPDKSSVQQEHRKQAIAVDGLKRVPVDSQAQRCTMPVDGSHKLSLVRRLLWLARHL
jgi:hypothetical protein